MTARALAGSVLAVLLFAAAARTVPGQSDDPCLRNHTDCNSAIVAWLPLHALDRAPVSAGNKISRRDGLCTAAKGASRRSCKPVQGMVQV
jgi:hypothetical protein